VGWNFFPPGQQSSVSVTEHLCHSCMLSAKVYSLMTEADAWKNLSRAVTRWPGVKYVTLRLHFWSRNHYSATPHYITNAYEVIS